MEKIFFLTLNNLKFAINFINKAYFLRSFLDQRSSKIAISSLVNSLKDVSSRLIRKKNYLFIQKALWGNSLWSPYFAKNRGGAPLEIVKQYITTIFRKNMNILAPLYPTHKWAGFNGVI